MTQLGFHTEPYLSSFGIDVSHRSRAVLHQAGEPGEVPVPLTETEVMRWLSQFLQHKVMIITFLGPSTGTLELKPYRQDDAETLEIRTFPGTLVVLRPDLLSHKHFSMGRSFAMTSFFMKTDGRRRTPAPEQMIPAAKELDDWTVGRLREIKEKNMTNQFWDPALPREWQSAMNHMFHKGQMICVRGMACKLPGTEDPRAFSAASSFAPDYPGEVPRVRWDHNEEIYDPDPESWRYFKSYCRHGSFMDGIELFDCKMFSMSPNEAKSMDPHQRLILEVGYEALYNMGMRKNTLVNTTCGVYVGCGNLEWSLMPRDQDQGAFAATGGALSISSGRFSFTLGLKGPSMTLDTDASSGATALYLGAESVQRKGRATPNDFSLGIAAHLLLAAVWWPSHCASGWLCAAGRCLTFDASAAGYVRGDGVAAVALKAQSQLVDGKFVTSEEEADGCIAGAMMNNNGKGASLASPHGPAEQDAMAEAIRNAGIMPADVDAVEAFGSGAFLADAIEVGSFSRAHRSEVQKDPPLILTAVKSSIGNQIETSGITAFMRVINTLRYGCATPNLHFRQANPHTDLEDQPVAITTELMEYQKSSSFVGVMSRGFGGSNVYLMTWGTVKMQKARSTVISSQDKIMYWPGGGGVLESDAMPARAYMIVGSWSEWQQAEAMEAEGDGSYSYTVILGDSRFEQFQIWLDGDSNRVLHPGHKKGYKDMTVFGPDNSAHGCNWVIDGRTELPSVKYPEELQSRLLSGPVQADRGDGDESKLPAADFGLPGDAYRVQLRVRGKWRTVTWEKLPPGKAQASLVEQFRRERQSQFYVTGSWNDWNLQEMTADARRDGVFHATAVLWRSGGEFQVLRNRDWSQVLHPEAPRTTANVLGKVQGPDDQGHGLNWFLDGQAGDTFRIELARSGEAGMFEHLVTWERIADEPRVSLADAARPRYCIVGSWDNWESPQEMDFDGDCYKYRLQLGTKGEESFQILLDGLWQRTIHPDRPDANPLLTHVLQGPSVSAHGLNWTVGRNDGGRPGSRYEVRLLLTRRGNLKNVDWSKTD
eukprot:TRINITY_DN90762_c0_g1_i1.p1 TRINITY_DN90762_c0_g1~~TRINITY_DN90762_c0_g1_i1.p1  ORF type:complete len:1166 (-),score=245.01 TRINITY_DN90762_c0_g1_i1:54-3194(-)